MRGLTRRVDESPGPVGPPPRCTAEPSTTWSLLDFVTDFVEHAVDDPAVRLSPGHIRDARPVVARTSSDSVSSRMHFSYRAMSPLHTAGPWDGAAAELLLARVRGQQFRHMGFFATGLPELPADAAPDAMAAAVINRERAEYLAEYFQAPAGQVLHNLRRDRSPETRRG
ncbi:hypothetical protein [Streptomyces rubrogriseus]|uniref:hypothetical protein n=1 Tax=Streptomyces rubrogriseus TaxID=194673 RepID=UPI0037D98231